MSSLNVFNLGLRGKTVLICGGTSGIGLSTAIQATASGAKVIIVGRNAVRARSAAERYGLSGWRAADINVQPEVDLALSNIIAVDHLVLAAGGNAIGGCRETEVAQLRHVFDERVWAALGVIRAVGSRLRSNGSITLISGAVANRPDAFGTAVLGAACAAMNALARGLAVELAPVRVNALSPGHINTPGLWASVGGAYEAYVAAVSRGLPLRRMGTAEQAGAGALFLMSNGWMNGATLHVDGGCRLV